MSDEKLNLKEFAIIFLLGSAFGTTTLLISEMSRLLFKVPLYLSPISIKNLFKTWFINGGTITGLVLILDTFGISEKKVKEELGFDEE